MSPFKSLILLVLVGSLVPFSKGNVVSGILGGTGPIDPLNLKSVCTSLITSSPEVFGLLLCPSQTNGPFEQETCDKHCQCAHAANYGTCKVDEGQTAYCSCEYDTPAPAGHRAWTDADPICAGWSTQVVNTFCNATQTSVVLPPIRPLLPLCTLECICSHRTASGACGTDSTGHQRCFCNRSP